MTNTYTGALTSLAMIDPEVWEEIAPHFSCDEADAMTGVLAFASGVAARAFALAHAESDDEHHDRHHICTPRCPSYPHKDDWAVKLTWGDGTDADTPTSVLGRWHADFVTAQATIWGTLVECDMEWWTIEPVDPENLKPLARIKVLAADIEEVRIT